MPSKTYCSQCGTANLYELGKKPTFCNGCGQPFNVGIGQAPKPVKKLRVIELEEEDEEFEDDEEGEEAEAMDIACEVETGYRTELSLHDLLEGKEARITNAPIKRKTVDPHMIAEAVEVAKSRKSQPAAPAKRRGRPKKS